jgi:hypothetical protein
MARDMVTAAIAWLHALAERTGAFTISDVQRLRVGRRKTHQSPWDLAVQVSPAGSSRTVRLLVEVQERLTPLVAIGILERMTAAPASGVRTLCSPSISERVADLCRSKGVSYLDEAGNCRISVPNFFLQVTGKQAARAAKQPEADPFAAKSSRVVRVLLGNPRRGWQVRQLADEAQVSLGLAAKVKQSLLEQAFVEIRDRLVYLRDPRALLDAWATGCAPPTERLPLYVMEDPAEAERKIAEWCLGQGVRYALTDLAGAWRVAPTVRYHQSAVYVETKGESAVLDDLVGELRAKRVDSGSNLTIWEPPDTFAFYQTREVSGIQVASPLQLYLDLHRQPGRAAEAAQEILEREIAPTW